MDATKGMCIVDDSFTRWNQRVRRRTTLRVLVVTRDVFARARFVRRLRAHSIEFCGSVGEALSRCATTTYDIVFLAGPEEPEGATHLEFVEALEHVNPRLSARVATWPAGQGAPGGAMRRLTVTTQRRSA